MRRLLALLFCFCSCEQITHSSPLRVGVDPNWYSVDLYGQEAYVNGYLEELLIVLSEETGLRFERIRANPDALLPELTAGQYDLVVNLSQTPQHRPDAAPTAPRIDRPLR